MLIRLALFLLSGSFLGSGLSLAQETGSNAAKPTEHVLGTVTAVDSAAHTVTVKEDNTGAEHNILLQNTKTLLKVPPGAKDLKSATRITADDLAVGDRVDVRGSKTENDPSAIAARSVVLMSARDLQQAHEAEATAWQHSTAGLVTSVDASAGKLNIAVRTAGVPKPVAVDVAKTTQFTRYSPATPKTPVPSQLADIQPGDQVRVIGEKSEDGSSVTAQKVYSGAFRTVGGTVVSISADGKEITLKSAIGSVPLEVTLNDESSVRKLPPEMALRLAMRLNPTYKPAGSASAGPGAAQTAGNAAGAPPYGAKSGEASGGSPGVNPSSGRWQGAGGGQAGGMRAGGGDLAQMIERVPKIAVTDLKPGDAVIVSGAATGSDNSHLIATNIIAGAEPILRAAPPRQGQSQNMDWNLGMEAPAQQ
ncbi:MAG: DUF5666 domain-containing protein [Bryobacteraceae bacterium]